MAEIFQKALNMSIAAGWLILAVIALRLLLRRAPKRFRLLLWAVVGLRLALPWSIESALSLIPSAQTLPEGIMLERAPVLDTGISALNGAINPGFTAAFTPELGASANPLQVLLPIAAAFWMLGAAAMLLWALVSWLRLRKRVREAVRLEENVYECEIASPFVLGLFRPRIYLPFSLENGERELVLAHERAHITAGDHIIKPLGWLLLAAHWYNPLVWLAYALFCRDIELACDERVVRGLSLSDRADYSQALLDLSRPRGGVRACPLAFGESSVKGRVKSVLSYKKPAFWLVLLAVVVCVGAAVCFLTDPKEEAEPVDDGDGGGVVISARLEENFPAQVLDYAFVCTEEMAEELSYLGLKSAELTDLSCYAEVEAPEGGTLLLFRLGARFELAEPESVAPAGGMVIEDGWLTRPDSGGDRFMLLLRDGDDWRFIGLVTEQVLSEYGTDYDAAALGEYATGLHDAGTDLLYVSLGTGLGAGLIVQGRLCRGRQNFGGEIGFMVFDRDFETDPARRGWLENRVSLQTLCGKYPFFARLAEGKACAQEGEETLRALTDEVGGYLALAIANINCLLDLDTVVLGGYTARLLGERLTDAVNRYLARLSSCHLVCKPQLCTEPSIAGAALLATEQKLQALFSDG